MSAGFAETGGDQARIERGPVPAGGDRRDIPRAARPRSALARAGRARRLLDRGEAPGVCHRSRAGHVQRARRARVQGANRGHGREIAARACSHRRVRRDSGCGRCNGSSRAPVVVDACDKDHDVLGRDTYPCGTRRTRSTFGVMDASTQSCGAVFEVAQSPPRPVGAGQAGPVVDHPEKKVGPCLDQDLHSGRFGVLDDV